MGEGMNEKRSEWVNLCKRDVCTNPSFARTRSLSLGSRGW